MRYGVIGTGAIGGFYGGKLAYAGFDVHFLLHSDYDFVHKNGLQIDSCDGSFYLRSPHIYPTIEQMPKCDVILVALKSVNNELLKVFLPTLLKPQTLVILIQNGIGLEADLQRNIPNLNIAAGLAFICSSKIEPGHIVHQYYGNLTIGNYSCRDHTIIEHVLSDFRVAKIGIMEAEYHLARWKKAVWNMPFNGMTALLRAQTNQLLANKSTREIIYRQMLEVIGAANALGIEALDASFALKMIENTEVMPPYSPSMKLDFELKRPMEIDYIYTRPIEEARAIGYNMPLLSMLEAELRFISTRA